MQGSKEGTPDIGSFPFAMLRRFYATYELAPRVIDGLDPITDQQAAAGILQVGSMFLLWVQIGYRFLAWGSREMESNRVAAKAMRGPGPSAA